MKPYNSKEPLIFIHIPKCAGTSIIKILIKWFGEKGLAHYYRKYKAMPPVKHLLKPGDYYDYTDIDDYLKERPRSSILKLMPYELNKKNFIEILEKYFVYIGIVEDIQTSIDHLAEKLDFPSIKIERLNRAERNEKLCEGKKKNL